MFDVTTEDAFLLVNLPNGKYVITAEFDSDTKQKKMNVGAKKPVIYCVAGQARAIDGSALQKKF